MWPRSERDWCSISCEGCPHRPQTQMLETCNACQVEAAVSSYTPLPTSLTISDLIWFGNPFTSCQRHGCAILRHVAKIWEAMMLYPLWASPAQTPNTDGGNYNGCQVEAAVSSHTPLPTSLTITVSEPYHVLTKVVTGWELTLMPDGNVLF